MTPRVAPRPVKVGVLLPPRPVDLGGWLADGASFEAAGAEVLWVSVAGSDLDPLALTAALAAVTVRSILVTTVPEDGSSRDRARTLATIARLSNGRLRVLAEPASSGDPAAIVPGLGVFRRIAADPAAFEHLGQPDGPQRWVSVPTPDGRASWRATLLDAADRDVHGLLVPAGPRLLDILRNPDDPGHRHDLQLAQG